MRFSNALVSRGEMPSVRATGRSAGMYDAEPQTVNMIFRYCNENLTYPRRYRPLVVQCIAAVDPFYPPSKSVS